MALPAEMAAALQGPSVLMFCALLAELPDGVKISLLDGAGYATFEVDGETQVFVGRDNDFGALGGLSEVVDGVAAEAPDLTLSMLPPTNAAMAVLVAPEAQRSRVRLWGGVMDEVAGTVLGVDLWFDGETNVSTQGVDAKNRTLTIVCNSALTNFLQADNGIRLNGGSHEKAWPGEKGLQFIISIEQSDAWGSDAPRSPIKYVPPVTSRLPVNLR